MEVLLRLKNKLRSVFKVLRLTALVIALFYVFIFFHFYTTEVKEGLVDAGVVKEFTWHFKFIPFMGFQSAVVYPNIYLPGDVYEKFSSGEMNAWEESVLIHERIHIERQGVYEGGPLRWNVRYLTNKEFRFDEEIFAIKKQMIFLKDSGEVYDIDRKAKHFSGGAYLWLMSYDDAYVSLSDVWNNI